MRHFSALSQPQRETLFHLAPAEIDPAGTREEIAGALGATLYCPATRQRLAGDLDRLARRGVVSAVACLEDSVADDEVTGAEETLVRELRALSGNPQWQDGPPLLLFLRTRSPEQLLDVVDRAGEGLACLQGFVLPKFGGRGRPDPEAWMQAVQKVSATAGRRLWAMPVLESAEIAHLDTRHLALLEVRAVLDEYREHVLAVRTGATDLSAAYGLRRPAGTSIWDVRVIADILGDVVNVLGRVDGSGYPITAPVFEHFPPGDRVLRSTLAESPFTEAGAEELRNQLLRRGLDGLVREVLLDQVNGLQGKTVIHPSHVGLVHALSVVTHEDHSDALDIVAAGRGGVMASSYRNKMNEAGPHRAWALRVLARAHAFGVARADVNYALILHEFEEALAAQEEVA